MISSRAVLASFLVLITAWAGAAPAPNVQAGDAADPEAYDVEFALRHPAPGALVLLDWREGSGLVLRCDAKATTLAFYASGRETVLGTGQPARAGLVRVQRRSPLVRVTQQGVVLLETWSRRPLGGTVAPAQGAGVTDLRVQPVAPVEFRDEFFDPSGGESQWEAVRGDWQMVQYRDPLVATQNGPIGAAWYEVRDARDAVAVTGNDFWDDYRLRVAVKSAPGCAVGVVFGYLDKGNYQALVVRPKSGDREADLSLRLVREGKAKETRLTSRAVPWQPNAWQELTLAVGGRRLQYGANGQMRHGVTEAAAPQSTAGQVGLYASGSGACQFDDLAVTPAQIQADSFGRAQLGECWRPTGGAWRLQRGRLECTAAAQVQCLREGSTPSAGYAEIVVQGKPTAAGIALLGDDRTYLFSVGARGAQIVRVTARGREVVAESVGAYSASATLGASWDARHLVLWCNGLASLVTRDLNFHPRRLALFATGTASFDDFHLESPSTVKPEHGAVISAISGQPATWPGENEGTSRPVLGFLWLARKGYWGPLKLDEETNGLKATPYGADPTALWYYVPCPGAAQMTAVKPRVPGNGALGVTVACTGEDSQSGYAAELTGGKSPALRLLRQGQVAAETACAKPGDELRVWVEGRDVVAQCGSANLSYTDQQPLTGDRCGAYARGKDVAVGELRLSNWKAEYYAFRSPETDWVPVRGEWNTHSGMACIAWDYWLTGKGEPEAWLFTRHDWGAGGTHVDFWVSEYTEGYANKEHKHFPYHDVSVVLGAPKPQGDQGYRFLIGGENGTVARLLRGDQVLVETRDPRFRIRMGGHCSTPRAIHVIADANGNRLTLSLNDQLALDYTAPEKVGQGYVGLGVTGCNVNFRDAWIAER